eukprot:XP_001692846.1 hypothetical protein CHLREDRAFT_186159 [Chlamydomonas reinhardtii]
MADSGWRGWSKGLLSQGAEVCGGGDTSGAWVCTPMQGAAAEDTDKEGWARRRMWCTVGLDTSLVGISCEYGMVWSEKLAQGAPVCMY